MALFTTGNFKIRIVNAVRFVRRLDGTFYRGITNIPSVDDSFRLH